MKIYSIALLGNKGGKAKKLADTSIIVPSNNTARIQECHIFIGHYILEQVENKLLKITCAVCQANSPTKQPLRHARG